MIDVSIYGLTEENARLLLSNTGIVGFFYIVGFITFSYFIIHNIVLGILYIHDFIKKRKENKAING